ncbi:MAG: GtrA family protein [Microbacteriaceae bacterium]
MRALLAQLVRFGGVGAVGLIVDAAVFNLLWLTVLHPDMVEDGPVLAKIISTTAAILCNWVGNRYWTFREHRRQAAAREGFEFAVVSMAGMLISVGCLWLSREVFGFTSLLADNIATNGVGLILGAAFRFALYRWWVFAPHRSSRMTPVAEAVPAAD